MIGVFRVCFVPDFNDLCSEPTPGSNLKSILEPSSDQLETDETISLARSVPKSRCQVKVPSIAEILRRFRVRIPRGAPAVPTIRRMFAGSWRV